MQEETQDAKSQTPKATVLSTGSKGNAVLYHGCILVDCGVSFNTLKPYLRELKIVLLTHQHGDHLNLKTLRRVQEERPTVRVACCQWLVSRLEGFQNVDILEVGKLYNYGAFQVSPLKLYHDVPNCGYRIFKDGYKILHATDTAHLHGITAKGYDLYAIEHNYDEEKSTKNIEEAQRQGTFCHALGSIATHLSYQQARDFIYRNQKPDSQILELHQSTSFY